MKLDPELLEEDYMIANCKRIIREVISDNNFREIWIPTETQKLSLDGRKKAEKEIRKEIPQGYVFNLDRIGVAYLAKPKVKTRIPSFLLEKKNETL